MRRHVINYPLAIFGGLCFQILQHQGFPSGAVVKNSPCNERDRGSNPGPGGVPRAMGQLCPSTTTAGARAPGARAPGARAPWSPSPWSPSPWSPSPWSPSPLEPEPPGARAPGARAPTARASGARAPWILSPWSPCSAAREATAGGSLYPATRESFLLEKARVLQRSHHCQKVNKLVN